MEIQTVAEPAGSIVKKRDSQVSSFTEVKYSQSLIASNLTKPYYGDYKKLLSRQFTSNGTRLPFSNEVDSKILR